MTRPGRPLGDRDYSRAEFLARYPRAFDVAAVATDGHVTEELLADELEITAKTLRRYRDEFGVPREGILYRPQRRVRPASSGLTGQEVRTLERHGTG